MKQISSGKIDIYSHILPHKYGEALYKKARGGYSLDERASLKAHHDRVSALIDLDSRFRVMDKYPGIRQVLTVTVPPLESVVDPRDAVELAAIANDEMAELIAKYPERFISAAACLPMNDIDAALREADRAIRELGFKGVQIFTPTNGRPIDGAEFMPLFQKMTEYDLPIWIHPVRDRSMADYASEDHSKYEIFSLLGWPYETAVAMARLVFSGVMEKSPKIKFITHHCGSMVPYFSHRVARAAQLIAQRRAHAEGSNGPPNREAIEYFKMFYADTAIYSKTALMCAYDFFGPEHILFGTDMPFGGENGDTYLSEATTSVESLDIADSDKNKILEGNARRLLHIK